MHSCDLAEAGRPLRLAVNQGHGSFEHFKLIVELWSGAEKVGRCLFNKFAHPLAASVPRVE